MGASGAGGSNHPGHCRTRLEADVEALLYIRMDAKRRALEAIVEKKGDTKPANEKPTIPTEVLTLRAGVVAATSVV